MTDHLKQKKGFFCSELIAAAYKKQGLLDPVKAASKYWPGDFEPSSKSIAFL